MKVDGGCHCGSIAFEAEIDPDAVAICHCTDCQQLSGTAFRVVVRTPEDQFTLVSGAPRTYVKTAESGARRAQVFCPECGSQIYATSTGDGPKVLSLLTGTLHQRGRIKPRVQRQARALRRARTRRSPCTSGSDSRSSAALPLSTRNGAVHVRRFWRGIGCRGGHPLVGGFLVRFTLPASFGRIQPPSP